MPYPFAHPAAAVPLHLLLGRHGVPSALAIGTLTPDLWYFVPLAERAQTHSAGGLVWFCLPAALLLYALFHLLLKRALVALLPDRLASRVAAYATPGLPAVPWLAVALSALAGAGSHLLWDLLTHGPDPYSRVLQHASTLLGTAFLAIWVWRKLRDVPPAARYARMPRALRWSILAALVAAAGVAGTAAAMEHLPLALELALLRGLARGAGLVAAETLAGGLLAYCVLWELAALYRSGLRTAAGNQDR
jgi:hypothetical protein